MDYNLNKKEACYPPLRPIATEHRPIECPYPTEGRPILGRPIPTGPCEEMIGGGLPLTETMGKKHFKNLPKPTPPLFRMQEDRYWRGEEAERLNRELNRELRSRGDRVPKQNRVDRERDPFLNQNQFPGDFGAMANEREPSPFLNPNQFPGDFGAMANVREHVPFLNQDQDFGMFDAHKADARERAPFPNQDQDFGMFDVNQANARERVPFLDLNQVPGDFGKKKAENQPNPLEKELVPFFAKGEEPETYGGIEDGKENWGTGAPHKNCRTI